MTTLSGGPARKLTPLEDFLRAYLDVAGGDWDEVEPQVYDVLTPPGDDGAAFGTDAGVVRLSFDPEALQDHPGTQLASFGTPLVDSLLGLASRRGRSARLHMAGLNLMPHDPAGRARRAIHLPSSLTLEVEQAAPHLFPQALFWFQAEFVSDQREQVLVPVGIDMHYTREVRHLDRLTDPARLTDRAPHVLPEAHHAGLHEVYLAAREQVVRSVSALANSRARDLHERGERQVARMRRYYADLRQELELPRRGRQPEDAEARLEARRQAIDREEEARIAELRQKTRLHVHLCLQQLLVVLQPKLLITAVVAGGPRGPRPLELVWDPLLDGVEAAPCGACGRPGYSFCLNRKGDVVCEACEENPRGARGIGHGAVRT